VVGRIAQTPLLVPIVNPLTGLPEQVLIPRATGVLAAEEREIHSRVLLRPRLSMISGEEHEIFAGENIPVPTAEVGDTGSNLLQTRQTIERRDTGVILRVQPTVFDVGPIVLDLYVEVSRFAGTTGNSDPIFSERTLTATARLQSGLTAVVGWASLPTTTRREVGTPYLSRIPILGALFRSSSEIALTTHLLIAVRAERDRPEAVVLTNWLRRELADRERPVAAATSPEVP
jgi:general secretion pathway protein D